MADVRATRVRRVYFDAVTAVVVRLLVHMASFARRAGDEHERAHIAAQLKVGDTTHCRENGCPVLAKTEQAGEVSEHGDD